MLLLILGLALWWGAHLFKRVMPTQRAAMGPSGKGAVAIAIVAGIVLMVIGYRSAEVVPVWSPPSFLIHVNNLLVLIGFYMATPAPKRGVLLNAVRHPMQIGFGLWAIAHLLVNGDLADIVLFGGLLLWVPVQIAAINRSEPAWTPRPKGSIAMDAMFLVATIVLIGVIGYIHGLVGPSPFGS